jgi:hypothetical protein
MGIFVSGPGDTPSDTGHGAIVRFEWVSGLCAERAALPLGTLSGQLLLTAECQLLGRRHGEDYSCCSSRNATTVKAACIRATITIPVANASGGRITVLVVSHKVTDLPVTWILVNVGVIAVVAVLASDRTVPIAVGVGVSLAVRCALAPMFVTRLT